jgi:hypothetical protein
MALLMRRMRLLQLTWTFLVIPLSEMLALFEQPTIGRWMCWFLSTLYCIPLESEKGRRRQALVGPFSQRGG